MSRKFLLVRLGTSSFAVPLAAVREVLGLPPIATLANMPPFFAGLLNLRGKIISAIDLKKSLKALRPTDRDHQSRRPCIVITEISGRLFGAIVDDVAEVVAVSDSEIDAATESMASGHVFLGVLKRQDQPLAPILDLEKALRIGEILQSSELAGAKSA